MDNLSVKRNGGEEFRSRLRTFLRKESLLRSERVYTNVMKVRRVQKNVERTAQVTSIPHKMSAGYLSYDFEEAEDDLVFKDEGISKLDDATRQDVVDILGDNTATKPSHKRIRTLKVQFSFNSSGDPIADRVHDALRRASDSIIVNGTYQGKIGYVMKIVVLDDQNGDFCMRIMLNDHLTVRDVWNEVAKAKGESANKLKGKYIMTYTYDSLTVEGEKKKFQLINQAQLLIQTHLYSLWCHNPSLFDEMPLVLEKPQKMESESNDGNVLNDETTAMQRINKLIDPEIDFDTTVYPQSFKCDRGDHSDIYIARRTLQSYVQEIVEGRDPEDYALSMDIENTEPNDGIQTRIPVSERIDMSFYYKNEDFTESVNVFLTAKEVMRIVVLPAFFPEVDDYDELSKDYCFRMNCEEMFISGDTPMIDFTIIRRLVFNEEEIHFLLVTKPDPIKDQVNTFLWPRVDCNTYSVCGDGHLNEIHAHNASQCSTVPLSAWKCTEEFKFSVEDLKGIYQQSKRFSLPRQNNSGLIPCDGAVHIQVGLYHGERCLQDDLCTSSKVMEHKSQISWREEIESRIMIKDLPKETKLLVKVKSFKQTLYWANFQLVDPGSNLLKKETHLLYLWPAQSGDDDILPDPVAPGLNNPAADAPVLTLHFGARPVDIVYPEDVPLSLNSSVLEGLSTIHGNVQIKNLIEILTKRFGWDSKDEVGAIHYLVEEIKTKGNLPFEMAFRLLDSDIADSEVRKLAVEKLKIIPIPDMKYYMLQLVQVLKFEWRHDNPLARLLLKAALLNKSFGGTFFWCVRSELYQPMHRMRFSILLEAYLSGCGEDMLRRFEDQLQFHDTIHRIAVHLLTKDYVKSLSNKEKSVKLKELLVETELDKASFRPLYNPRLSIGHLNPSKARIMTSKKEPIWLEFENIDPTAPRKILHKMIIKHEDDLRQDMLVLRVMSLIDRIWQEDDLDLHLIPYKCIATSCNSGVIEVVNGETIADITPNGSKCEIYQWLRNQHLRENGDVDLDRFHQAVVTFTKSLAGYSVVTFVLGITDRHNDNIMITKDGNIFHIDFGHILGNVKKFMGISREWTPFILSPDFVYVMGGENSAYFEMFRKLCIRGFLSLRRRANFVLNLFSLMRHSGIPNLKRFDGLEHIRNSLYLHKETEQKAEKAFNNDIDKSLRFSWTTELNFWVHVKSKQIKTNGIMRLPDYDC